MKIKRFCCFSIVFFTICIFSGNAVSAIITKHNFTYDSVLNKVEGNGLLWKRWDETNGLSIDSALEQFAAEGWRLATSIEMVDMYNIFIPSFDWNIALNENTSRGEYISVSEYQNLVSIFGSTIDAFGGISDVLFGEDLDLDGYYRVAYAQYSDLEPVAGIGADNSRFTSDYSNSNYSVQLVKPIPVPEPSNICWAFMFILLILIKNNNPTNKEKKQEHSLC